ncbi:carboxypeptidase-like regulatory domain-containing protein [Flavivirga amylovorans]|uniref:Carboxypeptidase-like regulatory domain-containing protein n=1 Tax=Flavivirga amylovorans TaxID=870486 RepID=A0ABT8X0A6_9FLAO|nr:carboxypeptidase-like regulatory domain-containing protein [Flavivirga amylovorans]MDO5987040.1 carboxypeptidase-like regulatory domain-containing protein [Flavivirga amylovorans]
MKKTLYLFILLIPFLSLSQEKLSINYQNTYLKTVLKDIETKSGLLFSYSETLVANKLINFIATSISIEDLLKELKKQTALTFDKISEKQIIIKAPKIDICGYLFDSDTKDNLPFATIVVQGTDHGTTTNESGFFELHNMDPNSNIVIQYLGYKDMRLPALELKEGTCKNLYLRTNAQALNDIIITAYITKGLNKNNDGSTLIRNDALGLLPGLTEPDVFKSLQLIPGITSLNESASDIQIRGGSQDQNLIYFDDIKMYNTGHFFGMISSINPYVVESTKIYKGGASPEYGDRVSGVIDISSANTVIDSTTIGIGINGTHADAFIKTPIAKSVGITASARRALTDVFQTPTYDAIADKVFQNTKVVTNNAGVVVEDDDDTSEISGENEFYFYDTNIKLIAEPSENDLITVSGLITKNDLNFSTIDDEDNTSDQLQIENQGASLLWSGTKFKKMKHSLKGYYSYFNSFYDNLFTEEGIVEEENLRKNRVEEYGFDAKIEYEFIDNHAIKLGYQYTNTGVFFQLFRDELDNNTIDPDDDEDVILSGDTRDFNEIKNQENQTHSIYGEYLFRPNNKGVLSLGVRASHYSAINDYFIEPRLNAEFPINKDIRLKVTAEKRYQTISQLVNFEDTQLRLENQIWTLSDGGDIPVLESTQFSSGFLIDLNGWIFDIDAYVKNIEGLTSFTNGFTNASEDFSTGESDIFGIDVLLKKKINDFNFWLGYTFNDVQYTFKSLQNSSFPGNNDVTNNFRASTSYNLGTWELSLGWMYRTGSPFTPVDNFNVTSGDIDFGLINSERLPNYHRLDASLLYHFKLSQRNKTRGVFGVSLQNIYSRQIPLSVFYRVDTNPNTGVEELDRIEQLSLGFTPNATFRLYF